jgi:hypothetical protein
MFQRTDLRAERHAAAERENLDVVGRPGQAAQLLGHLIGQLAGRAQHQRLATKEARVERAEQADAEGRGLAAAGLGLGDQVLALEDHRQTLCLDRRHLGIAEGVEVGQHGGGQGQGGEGGGHGGEPGGEGGRAV